MTAAGTEGLVTLTEAAQCLGVHYMTAYRYVRTGRLPAVKQGSEWRVRAKDLEALAAVGALTAAPAEPGTSGRRARRTNWSKRAEERLLAGDEAGAWAVVEAAMASGMAPEDLYLDVFVPALHSIGHRWATGEITVADEHRASGVVLRLVGRLGPRFTRRGRKRGTVILATPPGDSHAIPVALVADLLRSRSFDVADLGADVPVEALAATVADTARLQAVGLCSTVAGNDLGARRAIEAVRAVTDVPVILGGGAMLGRATTALALGADEGGLSTSELLAAFERLPTAGR